MEGGTQYTRRKKAGWDRKSYLNLAPRGKRQSKVGDKRKDHEKPDHSSQGKRKRLASRLDGEKPKGETGRGFGPLKKEGGLEDYWAVKGIKKKPVAGKKRGEGGYWTGVRRNGYKLGSRQESKRSFP